MMLNVLEQPWVHRLISRTRLPHLGNPGPFQLDPGLELGSSLRLHVSSKDSEMSSSGRDLHLERREARAQRRCLDGGLVDGELAGQSGHGKGGRAHPSLSTGRRERELLGSHRCARQERRSENQAREAQYLHGGVSGVRHEIRFTFTESDIVRENGRSGKFWAAFLRRDADMSIINIS